MKPDEYNAMTPYERETWKLLGQIKNLLEEIAKYGRE